MAIYSEVSHQEIVIFHSFVSLPEGSMKWITPADFQLHFLLKDCFKILTARLIG